MLHILYFSCSLFISLPLIAQNKHAVLIGVGTYPATSGWQNLSSRNDIILLQATLIKLGFSENKIDTLLDQDATKANILQLLGQLSNKVEKGDIVFVHFSGHGQQVADTNGDEIDGFDEAIVPHDSPKNYFKDVNEGEKLIRDEELGQVLQELRIVLGSSGHLLVTLDACHSGTGTRGIGVARGTDIKMASPAYIAGSNKKLQEDNYLDGEYTSDTKIPLASMVTFFSTAANQLSYEYRNELGKGFGFLSYAFSKALTTKKITSYAALLEAIQLEISLQGGIQRPQMEGIGAQEIFNGNYLQQITYFKVKEIIEPHLLVLNAGRLQGITKGSSVAFYKPNDFNSHTASPIAIGKVDHATLLESDVLLESDITAQELLHSKVMVKDRFFEQIKIDVQLDLSEKEFKANFEDQIKNYKTISIVSSAADLLVKSESDSIQLITSQGTNLLKIKRQDAVIAELINRILQYAQADLLRALEFKGDQIELDVSILKNNSKEEQTSFSIGDSMQIQITNIGRQTAYYQMIDIQPDNQFSIIVPFANYQAEDFVIAPGETQVIPTPFEIYYPLGQELLKVIASNKPLNLNPVVNIKGIAKEAINPLEKLLKPNYFKSNKKGTKSNISATTIGITSVVFEIKESQ